MAITIQQRVCGASRVARPTYAVSFHAAAAARSGAAVGTPCGMPRQVSLRSVAATAAPKGKSAAPAAPVRAPKKKSRNLVDINGDVDKDLGNGMFKIKLENGVTVMAHLSGKIRQNRIKIVMGDKVTVELSPYDLTKGRITYRYRPGEFDKLQAEANAAASAAEEAS